MQRELLPLPIECENLGSDLSKRSFLRICITILAFLASFYGLAVLMRWEAFSQILRTQHFLVSFLFMVASVSLIFYLVISISTYFLIKLLPGDPVYTISSEAVEINSQSEGSKKVFQNSGISSLEEHAEGFYRVTKGSEVYLLPRVVNPIGSSIRILVIPFSRHTGLTFFRIHEICLIDGQIRVARVWNGKLKSSRYY
jgi:hypothetical protein